MGSTVMKNLSNSKLLSILINLLFLTLFAKFLSVILLLFLPFESQTSSKSNIERMSYRRFNFEKLITGSKISEIEPNRALKGADDITSMVLVGLYGNSKYGYAIVAKKSAPKKTEIISIGEKYQGYKLKRIALNFVVFVKHNKEYILRLSDFVNTKQMQKSVNTVQDDEQSVTVARSDINAYIKNPTQIWRDISIQEIMQNGEISGFKVGKVRKNSKIARLGLQRGDIILKANGLALTSYNAAFKIYKDINKLENLSLLIKRGNEEKEIIYEIH